jgi:hypothetical protein
MTTLGFALSRRIETRSTACLAAHSSRGRKIWHSRPAFATTVFILVSMSSVSSILSTSAQVMSPTGELSSLARRASSCCVAELMYFTGD